MIYLIALLGFYFGVVYAFGRSRRAQPLATAAAMPRGGGVIRPLFLALLITFCVDVAIFHSGFYQRFSVPLSGGGRVALYAFAEKSRVTSATREVAVVGDSRIFEGFSAPLANELTAAAGYHFSNLSPEGSSPRVWYYLLREVDPSATRYSCVVLPFHSDEWPEGAPLRGTPVDRMLSAPLLRITDALQFAGAFEKRSDKFAAFAACILRGSAYRSDLANFLEHPLWRIAESRRQRNDAAVTFEHSMHPESAAGAVFNAETGRAEVPPQYSRQVQSTIQNNTAVLQKENAGTKPPGYWTGEIPGPYTLRIIDRYRRAGARVLMFRMPRGALGLQVSSRGLPKIPDAELRSHGAEIVEQTAFFPLETPEHFFDGSHVNEKGRQEITRRLVSEITAVDLPARGL
ncbi:hypothetical protein BH18VER1_BH18VER1_17470 [soil metagenome]